MNYERRKRMFNYFRKQQEQSRKEKQEGKEIAAKYGKLYTKGEDAVVKTIVGLLIVLMIVLMAITNRAEVHKMTQLQFDAYEIEFMFTGLMLFLVAGIIYASALSRRIKQLVKLLKEKEQ